MTDPPSQYDGLPTSWSKSARETYVQIDEEHGPLDAAAGAALYEVCALLATADALDERVAEDGLMLTGSTGQPVVHPAIPEARLARTQALAALARLGLGARSGASAAGAALAVRRHRGRTPGVRAAGA